MRLKHFQARNFRCLRDVDFPLDDVTVLIGENNSGKSAVLDALRLSLRGGQGRRMAAVGEYDFHLPDRNSDPRTRGALEVDLEFGERGTEEWPEELEQDLADIVQLDVERDRKAVRLRFGSVYDPGATEPTTSWQFLNLEGDPIRSKGGPLEGLRRLQQYVLLHALAALRDAGDHFSQRSGLWAPLLRSMVISEADRTHLESSLEELNERLLNSDPRLGEIRSTLEGLGNVMSEAGGHEVMVRALPLKPWELMSRAEVVVRAGQDRAELPLERHGQGVQTLSVLFLFKAYVQHFLRATSKEGAEPLLTLEEPEAHLHPQSARALWREIQSLPGQVIIASHSPYFVQYVPFRKLRVLRRSSAGTQVWWLKESYSTRLTPGLDPLVRFCQSRGPDYEYNAVSGELTIRCRMETDDFRRLAKASPGDVKALVRLRAEAASYLSDEELLPLESAVRRIRGEILFARVWLVCEGESDLLILQVLAEVLGNPLDRYGISIVDRSGGTSSFGHFASLARALGFPWLAMVDGDTAGDGFIREFLNRGFSPSEVAARAVQLPKGLKLEGFLVSEGFREDLAEVAKELTGFAAAPTEPDFDVLLIKALETEKTGWARALSRRLLEAKAGRERVPSLLKQLLERAVAESAS